MSGKHEAKESMTEHLFEYRTVEKRKLILSLVITLSVMVLELIGGYYSRSIGLISDAGHMFTHSFAIGIGLVAILIARKPPCHHRTFGMYRAEILAAFINGLFLLLVVAVLIYEAVLRILNPENILGLQMLAVALIGLAVNVISALILYGSHEGDLNIKSVFYHLIADAASSVGIVVAAIVIFFTGWNILDPLVSLGISAAIIYWAWGILKETSTILMEIAPSGLDIDTIRDDVKSRFSEVQEMFNIHIWTITPDMLVFTAHMKINHSGKEPVDQHQLLKAINKFLCDKYHIIEATIQIASEDEHEVCNIPGANQSTKRGEKK